MEKSSPSLTTLASFRFGWWMLLLFLFLGTVLEAFHGFKVPFYVDEDWQIRRSLWRAAHGTGTLFSVMNILFAATAARRGDEALRLGRWLMLGTIQVPLGFLGGGYFADRHSAGTSIVLVFLGLACLAVTLALVARSTYRPVTTLE